MDATNGMRPVHPGEILREELDGIGLSANALSKVLDVPVNRVTMILNGQRGVSAVSALRLARYFGTTPQFWLNLQKTWELRQAEIAAGREIAERLLSRTPSRSDMNALRECPGYAEWIKQAQTPPPDKEATPGQTDDLMALSRPLTWLNITTRVTHRVTRSRCRGWNRNRCDLHGPERLSKNHHCKTGTET